MRPDYQEALKIIKQIIKHIIRFITLKDLNLRITTGLDSTLVRLAYQEALKKMIKQIIKQIIRSITLNDLTLRLKEGLDSNLVRPAYQKAFKITKQTIKDIIRSIT